MRYEAACGSARVTMWCMVASAVLGGCYLSHPLEGGAEAPIDAGRTRDGTAPPSSTDAAVEPRAVSIAAGGQHTCAVTDDGTVWCWGDNLAQQLAAVAHPLSTTPVRARGVSGAVQVAAGERHTCARLRRGSVECWGRTGHTPWTGPRPAAVEGVRGAADLDCGDDFCCTVVVGGRVACWGYNGDGQLGDGSTDSRDAGDHVLGIRDAVEVTTGGSHACALRESGRISCWGNNRNARLGNGMGGPDPVPEPVDVRHIDDGVSVAAGNHHTCAARSSGELWCWGFNRQGQAGRAGSLEQVNDPSPVPSVSRAVAVGAGALHTCFLRDDGSVRCFGSNQWGALGDGTGVDSHRPVEPVGSPRARALTLGESTGGAHGHTCVLGDSGGVSCWGANEHGQLGDGTSVSSLAPTRVVDLR